MKKKRIKRIARRFLFELKNVLLKASVKVACLMFILGGCLADSNSYAPMLIMTVSASWITLMAYANGHMCISAKKERA